MVNEYLGADRDETVWAYDPDDITGERQEEFCN